MILSNIQIQQAIDEGRLIISPDPQPRSTDQPNCPYGTTAVDLHLAGSLSVPKHGAFNYDLRQGGIATFLARNSDHLEIPKTGYVLNNHLFVLGRTQEKVTLPIIEGQTLAARIEGKSSFARCGLLIHFTAPTVHAGFDGTLTLEMINLGNAGITLYEGMPIAQLILEAVLGVPQAKPGQFQGQSMPAGTSSSK
jgi:dCTP deaminase